jgi:hypothetical protein
MSDGLEGKIPKFKSSKSKKHYQSEAFKDNLPKFKQWYQEQHEVQK